MVKGLKSDSAPYLKSWLDSLKESPDFLKTILVDVKRASSMLTQRIDGINERIEKGLSPVADEWKQEHEKTRDVPAESEQIAAKSAKAQVKEETEEVKNEQEEETVSRPRFRR